MKYVITFLLTVVSFCNLQAQEMKQLFIELPDSIAPLLTKVNREDCVDFLDSQMKAEVKNRFGNPSELKELTANYLFLQTTEQSTLQLKLLPQNDSVNIVCAIFTACAPACDSEVRFYTTEWKSLPAAHYITPPLQEAFLQSTDSLNSEFTSLKKLLDMHLIKVDASSGTHELFISYATPTYLSSDDQKRIAPYIKETPLRYVWRNGKFEWME
ncbi:MAG: DUF3256 family protein [Phocaeicola sp.]